MNKNEKINLYLDSRGKYDPRKSESRRKILKMIRSKKEKKPIWDGINPRLVEADAIDKLIMALAEHFSAKSH